MSVRSDTSTEHADEGELFSRPKRGPGCASAWEMSRAALGLLPPRAQHAFDAHRAGCEPCAQRWKARLEAETNVEPVPSALLDRARALAELRTSEARRARTRARWLTQTAALTAAAALALLSLGEHPPAAERLNRAIPIRAALLRPEAQATEERLKGAIPIRAAVLRREAQAAEEVEIERARVVPGDRLRLGVDAPKEAGVLLQGWEEGKWTDYFLGTANDPWLPVGVEITGAEQTRLRVVLCPTPQRLEALRRDFGPEPPPEALQQAGCLERRIEL